MAQESRILPREPRIGDVFTGEVTHRFRNHPGLLVDYVGLVLFLPLEYIDQNEPNHDALVGRWVECEVAYIDDNKRAVVVRPIAWLNTDDERRASYERTTRFWMSQCADPPPT
jgi:ribosomal protein S1